jgi:plastocyanin
MRRWMAIGAVLALLLTGCGDGDGGGDEAGGGAERTVLVDYRHDQFASAFLRYYPEQVTVRAGDTVRFKQAWTGEPHSVTMGQVVDELFTNAELLEKYDSPEEALADGVSQAKIDEVLSSLGKVPGMTGDGYDVYQPGAQPCYIADKDDIPQWVDIMTEEIDPDAECPEGGQEQPDFDGTQGLYNSGFIPPDGDSANTFVLPIADDAKPGTYMYYCNYHWTSMSGSVEVVAADEEIPSQDEVNRRARQEIEEDAKVALEKLDEAEGAESVESSAGKLKLPLAGREADDEFAVIINEFLPSKIEARRNRPVTWTFDGIAHTVSFNVPKYFPVFEVEDDGEVVWNPKSYEPVGWDVPPQPEDDFSDPEGEGPEPRRVDVGKWDGSGGFHSSGAFDPGETFTVTFTKTGTYAYACVLHPQMVGTVTVKD